MKKSSRIFAFSLIEIVVAMGVVSFSLTAMMGLLSVSLGSSKASTEDTVLAAMASDILGDLRRQSFANAQTYVQASTPAVTYFDSNGQRLRDKTGLVDLDRTAALAVGALYQCTQTAQVDGDTSSASGTANLLRAKLTFVWPAVAPSPTNSRVIHATIAKY
ncbi:MAG: hypothetical protein ACFUZC_21420 [Chthoniobacteraceae bacterium]